MIHSDNDFATVAYLRVKSGRLEEKEQTRPIDPSIPPLLDETFEEVQTALEQSLISSSTPAAPPEYAIGEALLYFPTSSKSIGPWVAVTDVRKGPSSSESLSIEDEVIHCFQNLKGMVSYNFSSADCSSSLCRPPPRTLTRLVTLQQY